MLGIRIDPDLKDLLQKLADEEDRSLSNFVVRALITYLKECRGIDLKKLKK